jgi:hypothetical protein
VGRGSLTISCRKRLHPSAAVTAPHPLMCPGKGTFFVTEQLRLNQRVRNRRTANAGPGELRQVCRRVPQETDASLDQRFLN